jgi:hypothetical protein
VFQVTPVSVQVSASGCASNAPDGWSCRVVEIRRMPRVTTFPAGTAALVSKPN